MGIDKEEREFLDRELKTIPAFKEKIAAIFEEEDKPSCRPTTHCSVGIKIEGKLQRIGKDMHFMDATTSSQDKLAGDIMAYEIGDLFIDCNHLPPIEQWQRVMKALRVHGFKISFYS